MNIENTFKINDGSEVTVKIEASEIKKVEIGIYRHSVPLGTVTGSATLPTQKMAGTQTQATSPNFFAKAFKNDIVQHAIRVGAGEVTVNSIKAGKKMIEEFIKQ